MIDAVSAEIAAQSSSGAAFDDIIMLALKRI
jgi:hypothetical protein